MSPARVTALALGLDSESRKSLKPADREQLLFDRGYIWISSSKEQARPTAAGLLLAGKDKDPTSLFPDCRIQLDVYPGRSTDDEALVAESIRSNVPDAIGWTVVSREEAEQRRGFDPDVPPFRLANVVRSATTHPS